MKNIAIILFSLLSIIILACDENSTEPEEVLILSDGFERFGSPTHVGWEIVPGLVDFEGDSPDEIEGSIYSLKLMPGNDIEGSAVKYLDSEHGGGIYEFSVWAKMSRFQPEETGYVEFGVLEEDVLTQVSTIMLTDTTWSQITITDTLTIGVAGRLYINLSCGSGQTGDEWYTLFDAVKIYKR